MALQVIVGGTARQVRERAVGKEPQDQGTVGGMAYQGQEKVDGRAQQLQETAGDKVQDQGWRWRRAWGYIAKECRRQVLERSMASGCTVEARMELELELDPMVTCHMGSLRKAHHMAKAEQEQPGEIAGPGSVAHACSAHHRS